MLTGPPGTTGLIFNPGMENERYSPADRKQKLYLVCSVLVVLVGLFAFAAYRASVIAATLVVSVFVVVCLLGDVTLRLCQTLVTIAMDVSQEFGESVLSTARGHFILNTASATIVVVSLLLCLGLSVIIRKCPLSYAWDFGPYVCVPLMIFSYCLLRLSDLAEWETASQPDLSFMQGLDCGTSMAYSFYYGYLRLTLPTTGTSRKGIIEKIENFEDNHDVRFAVHKLFILVPSSGYVPPDLKEASYRWMESVSQLEEEKRNRAGNIDRLYFNSAYKIHPGGRNSSNEPVYVVVEGASPLLTFYEIQKHNHPESSVYKRHKSKIIETFYVKLQEILQSNPETRNLCELIYYNDYDANGEEVNVAKIILERISEIRDSA